MSDPRATSTNEHVRRLLEEATQADPGTLVSSTELKEHEGWDSLGAVMFIGLVQEHLGVELSVGDLRACATVADLEACVCRLQVEAAG